jgi:hypothetical protein
MSVLLPVEAALWEEAAHPETRFVWLNLWNVLPRCVHTDAADLAPFVDLLCERINAHRELVRPICHIVEVIGSHCGGFEHLLVALANASIDPSTASCTSPAIAALVAAMDSRVVNAFFVRLMHERVVPFARERNNTDVPCAMIDVALALLPVLDEENRDVFYQILLSLVRQQNQFQKKALRGLRQFLIAFPVPSASADLSAVLAECATSSSSSATGCCSWGRCSGSPTQRHRQ